MFLCSKRIFCSMKMDRVVMKQLSVVLIVFWSSVVNGSAVGHVVPSESQLLMKSDGDIIELFKSRGSWLRMVLLFSRDTTNDSQSQLEHLAVDGSSASTSMDNTIATDGKPSVTTVEASEVPKPTKAQYETTTATVHSTIPLSIDTCQVNFTLVSGQCYHTSSNAASWYNALKGCQGLDSDLAHPNSFEEHVRLKTYINNNNDKNILSWWIGGSDEREEGKWVWSHDNSTFTYTTWFVGEPNGKVNGNCLQMRHDCTWTDDACTDERYFICQKLPLRN